MIKKGVFIKRGSSGFTLLELMIVIIIIGVLAGLAMPRLFKMIKRAQAAEAIMNLRTIHDAVERCVLLRNINIYHMVNNSEDTYCHVFQDCFQNLFDHIDIEDPSDVSGSHFKYDYFVGGLQSTGFYYAIAAVHKESVNDKIVLIFATSSDYVGISSGGEVWEISGEEGSTMEDELYIVGFGIYKGIVTTEGYL